MARDFGRLTMISSARWSKVASFACRVYSNEVDQRLSASFVGS